MVITEPSITVCTSGSPFLQLFIVNPFIIIAYYVAENARKQWWMWKGI